MIDIKQLMEQAGVEPSAWMFMLNMELSQVDIRVSLEPNHNFGRVGIDFDPSYTVSKTELFTESDIIKIIELEVEQYRKDAARYRWVKANTKERLFNPRGADSEIMPDMRTKWEFPLLICSGPVGGYVELDEAIDEQLAAHNKEQQ